MTLWMAMWGITIREDECCDITEGRPNYPA